MTDTVWSRNVRARLSRQYPRIPLDEIDAMLALWSRVLEPELPAGELERAVETQVQAALRSLTHTLPRQRSGPDRVPMRV
jgi:hypothetical protein